MNARNFKSSSNFPYGFWSHEKIDEFNGDGNTIDMGDRWLDTRLGRTPKMDAHSKKYPDVSPYSIAANNPIMFLDKDGNDVVAPSEEGRQLVLSTLNYAFGKENGFAFKENKLIHNGEPPKNMTSQQQLMFTYITKTILNSKSIVNVNVYADKTEHQKLDGSVIQVKLENGNAGLTTYQEKQGGVNDHAPANSQIAIPGTTMVDGVNVSTTDGILSVSKEHALLHEIAHSIVNTIMGEFKGNFNGVDFNKMKDNERSDWAIKFTNTLLESQKKPLSSSFVTRMF